MEADELETLSFRKEENEGIKWINFENVADEEVVDFIRPIHKKLFEKLKITNL